MKATLVLASAVLGCAGVEGARGDGRAGGSRVVEIGAYDLSQGPLPSADEVRDHPGIVVLENVQPEHQASIAATFGKSHPQTFDRSADLGVVVRAQGQLLRAEPLELGLRRKELLLVIEAPAGPGSMFHAARPNTDPYWETEELLVFDPRLGRVVLSPDSRKIFLIYPLGAP